MTKSSVEEYVSDPNNRRIFLQERAILQVTTHLEKAMESKRVSRAELARRLGKTKGWVTQLLDGEANKTIRTIADAFAVLGLEFRPSYGQIQISNADRTEAMPQVRSVAGSTSVRHIIPIREAQPQPGWPAITSEIAFQEVG